MADDPNVKAPVDATNAGSDASLPKGGAAPAIKTSKTVKKHDETIPGGLYVSRTGHFVNAHGHYIDQKGNVVKEPIKSPDFED